MLFIIAFLYRANGYVHMPRASGVPRLINKLNTEVNDRLVGKKSNGRSVRYSSSLVNFQRIDKPYDGDRINDN